MSHPVGKWQYLRWETEYHFARDVDMASVMDEDVAFSPWLYYQYWILPVAVCAEIVQ